MASIDKAVLDSRSEPLIILGVESSVVETSEYRIFVEFDVVSGDMMRIFHS